MHLKLADLLVPCHLETLSSLLMDADLGAWMIDEGDLARMIMGRVGEYPSAMLQLWRSLGNQYDASQFTYLLPDLFTLAASAGNAAQYPCPYTVYLDMISSLVSDDATEALTSGLESLQSHLQVSKSSLGMERLWLIRLWRRCLLESLEPLHAKLKIPQTMLSLFQQFPEHTLLHTEFVEYVSVICDTSPDLLNLVLPSLPKLIMNEFARARSLSEQPRQGRPTWMGHLLQLASMMPAGCADGWDSFVKDHLSYYQQQMQVQLGGTRPPIPSAGSDLDEQFLNWGSTWSSPQDEQLARYFCQQIIGRMAHLGILDDEEEQEEEEVPSIGIPISGAGGAFDNLIDRPNSADEDFSPDDEEDGFGEEVGNPSSAQIRWILNQM